MMSAQGWSVDAFGNSSGGGGGGGGSGLYMPGSGGHWADGWHYDDWVFGQGSETYRTGLEAGASDEGGYLYIFDRAGQHKWEKNENGTFGYWKVDDRSWGYEDEEGGGVQANRDIFVTTAASYILNNPWGPFNPKPEDPLSAVVNVIGAQLNFWGAATTIGLEQGKPRYTGPKTWANQVKAGTKFGNWLGYGGLMLTAYDVYSNGLNTTNTLDAAFGIISFAGLPGAVIGGTYFGVNLLTKAITGKTLGEHVDENYIMVGAAGTAVPLMFIPKVK